jgi:hypothetical protein
MNTMMAHHTSLIDLIQCAIVENYLNIPPTPITKVVDMLRVKGSLQCRKVLIVLDLVGTIHEPANLN